MSNSESDVITELTWIGDHQKIPLRTCEILRDKLSLTRREGGGKLRVGIRAS